jgi:hypothetical protein
MDPNPKEFPILAYVLSQLNPTSHPPLPPHLQETLLTQLPYLNHPKVLASLAQGIPDLTQSQRQPLLPNLGQRPDRSAVAVARDKLAEIEANTLRQNKAIAVVDGVVVDRVQKGKEQVAEAEAETEAQIYKAVLRLEEMHEEYEKQLREAEHRLVEIYRSIVGELEEEEVVGILKEAESGVVERVELCGRQLRFLPEAFGKLHALLVLNLSHNQLEVSTNFGSIKPLKAIL